MLRMAFAQSFGLFTSKNKATEVPAPKADNWEELFELLLK